jgi:surfeit locus 1 family protein
VLSAARSALPLGFTLLVVLAAVAFTALGRWQWHKGQFRAAEWQRFASGAAQTIELGGRDPDSLPQFQRVSVTGSFDAAHQFLLDNRSYNGNPGYEVLTPLARAGAITLLVDRGWVSFSGSRATLPSVSLALDGAVRVSGRLSALPSAGLASGRAPPPSEGAWPKVTSFPSAAQLATALGTPIAARIVLLDASAPFGYVRDWQPPGMPPLRHFSYAIQWWCFAAMALIAWEVVRRRASRGGTP